TPGRRARLVGRVAGVALARPPSVVIVAPPRERGPHRPRRRLAMPDPGPRRRGPRSCLSTLCLTLAAGGALLQGGRLPVGAGVAGGAAATGYVYYKGRLYRDSPASLGDSLAAVRTGLVELQFPITGEEVKNGSGYLTSKTADGSTIRMYL